MDINSLTLEKFTFYIISHFSMFLAMFGSITKNFVNY